MFYLRGMQLTRSMIRLLWKKKICEDRLEKYVWKVEGLQSSAWEKSAHERSGQEIAL